MPKFVELENQSRRIFFENLKKNINCTWENFFIKYKISRASFFNYLSGRYSIPKEIFYDWQNISKTRPLLKKELERSRYIPKRVPPVKLDKKLAEILGILNGDGHLSKLKYGICVAGNRLEQDYFDYLKNLFESKFKIRFRVFEVQSGLKIQAYSKQLSEILIETYGLPKGDKMGKLKIPPQIKSNKLLLINYIRGLFDTDGTFYIRRESDPVIEISSGDSRFLNDVHLALLFLGFNAKKYQKHVSMYGLREATKFFSLIKPANNKHLKKFSLYNINRRR